MMLKQFKLSKDEWQKVGFVAVLTAVGWALGDGSMYGLMGFLAIWAREIWQEWGKEPGLSFKRRLELIWPSSWDRKDNGKVAPNIRDWGAGLLSLIASTLICGVIASII